MTSFEKVDAVRQTLLKRYETLEVKTDILKAPEIKELLHSIKDQIQKIVRPLAKQSMPSVKS